MGVLPSFTEFGRQRGPQPSWSPSDPLSFHFYWHFVLWFRQRSVLLYKLRTQRNRTKKNEAKQSKTKHASFRMASAAIRSNISAQRKYLILYLKKKRRKMTKFARLGTENEANRLNEKGDQFLCFLSTGTSLNCLAWSNKSIRFLFFSWNSGSHSFVGAGEKNRQNRATKRTKCKKKGNGSKTTKKKTNGGRPRRNSVSDVSSSDRSLHFTRTRFSQEKLGKSK